MSNNDYANRLNSLLHPSEEKIGVVLDLFAGAGGLALGFEAQGLKTIGVEKEADFCQTYQSKFDQI